MIEISRPPTPTLSALTTRDVPLAELTPRDVERWTALAEQALEPNPFFESDFLLPAARHLEESRTSLVVVEDADGWRACLPVHRVRLGGVMPAIRTWRHLYCFLATPLLDRTSFEPAARALLVHTLGSGAGLLALEHRGGDGPVSEALRLGAERLGLETVFEAGHERALLERQSGGGYTETLSRSRRRDLERSKRRLEEDLGAAATVTDESGDDAALDAFIELELSGWKGREGTALGSDPRHAAFFREVGRAFAARGRLELLTLRVGERRVAMVCNLYSGDAGFCFKVAHDEELRRYSPGVQLERESMRIFHEQRTERWQDSCADAQNTMMNRMWPGRRSITTTVVARPGLRASVARGGIRLARHRVNQRSKSSQPS